MNHHSLFPENKLFASNNKNVIPGNMLHGNPHNNLSQGSKSKSLKKVSRPSRNNNIAVRRYSTTESDDQIDSRKAKAIPPSSDKHKKEPILNTDPHSSVTDASAITSSQNNTSQPSSPETNTSSLFQDVPVIPFPMSMPQAIVPVDKSINDASNETVLDNDNPTNSSHDCNVSFVSSSDEAKESSEADSERISNNPLDSSPISSNRKKLRELILYYWIPLTQ
jgi:hypothetical protein